MIDSKPVQYVVFSDDWGRHPSSCQHLTRRLLEHGPALWVNTIGTRLPRPTISDARKVIRKTVNWLTPTRMAPRATSAVSHTTPENLRVINPVMYPGFGKPWQRNFNCKRITNAVHRALGSRNGETRIAITTVPITADLVDKLDVDRWVYYCVDDFSVWPGLDGPVMRRMEQMLVQRVDQIVVASDNLMKRIADMGRFSQLLTHGIDLPHWADPGSVMEVEDWHWINDLPRPVYLFWGLIDQRLDTEWIKQLSRRQPHSSIVLVGPQQDAPPMLSRMNNVVLPGSAEYDELPLIARLCDVLIMPYADLPVTRAMQPLKFKEYLACPRPVVARGLPAVMPWADAADLVHDAFSFATLAMVRAEEGLPNDQLAARARLANESWDRKAEAFEALVSAA